MTRPRASRTPDGPRAAQRDSLDFRDWIYRPALVPLPEYVLPELRSIHLLDQGEEGACTGFGLAAVINYLIRARGGPARERVSARMLYEMAKRHDRWPGRRYDGSTARGAMKGWYKNGVCHEDEWPYEVDDPGSLDDAAREGALRYPLGAFYRVLPKHAHVHAALVEAGAVYATAATHVGWNEDRLEDGLIPYRSTWKEQGGHAFAVLGYTHEGFLIQNSWGRRWGGVDFDDVSYRGCALWRYDDFDFNVWDLWVARLARPLDSLEALARSSERRAEVATGSPPVRKGPARLTVRDHYIHVDDGAFDPHGDYWSSPEETRRIVREAVASGAKHLLFYGHGGLESVDDAARRVARWRPVFRANGIHEIHFIWETGLLAELRDVLLGKQTFAEQRAGGASDWSDRWLERITGPLGRGLWHEIQSDAEIAFRPERAGTVVLETLAAALADRPPSQRPALHLVGHSAGAIWIGHLLSRWRALAGDLRFENLVLFASACSHDFFRAHLRPALEERAVERMHHMLLDDRTERADQVAAIYRKSILYLVSRAYQRKGEVVPIMGMEAFLDQLPTAGIARRVRHYITGRDPERTASPDHVGFDNDPNTMNTMLALVLGSEPARRFESGDLEGY